MASTSRERSTATSPDRLCGAPDRSTDASLLSDDLRASVNYFGRGELSAYSWLRSFKGRKELAWFNWDDPLPFLMVWARFAIRGIGKIIQIGPSKSNAARQSAGVDQERKSDRGMSIPQYGLWSHLSSIVSSVRQSLVRPRSE
jgi:hypothetical protein